MSKPKIDTFNGDLDNLAKMAATAWRDEYSRGGFPDLYRKELLEYFLTGIEPEHHLAAYDDDGNIIGFLGNLDRDYYVNGEVKHGALSCLLFTHKDYMRKGLAMDVIRETVAVNDRKQVIDFSLNYLDRGHRSTYMINKFSQNYTIETVREMYAITKVIDLQKVKENQKLKWYEVAGIKALRSHGIPRLKDVDGKVRPFAKEDTKACMDLLNSHRDHLPFSRVWTEKEAETQLYYPPVCYTIVYEKNGKIEGLMSYTVVEHLGPVSANYAWLNHVHNRNLTKREQKHLVTAFLQDAADKECAAVLEWNKGYYDKGALWKCGFIPYPRVLKLVSWQFNPEVSLASIKGYYEQHI